MLTKLVTCSVTYESDKMQVTKMYMKELQDICMLE